MEADLLEAQDARLGRAMLRSHEIRAYLEGAGGGALLTVTGDVPAGTRAGMEFLAPLVAFLAISFFLRQRADEPRPVQWGWLAIIVGLAALAWLVGAVTR